MRILVSGPQGSGKTTQAEILAKKFHLCLIKTGDLLRKKAKGRDEIAKSLRRSLGKGEFSNDKIVASIIKSELTYQGCSENFVMDGYPRRVSQLKIFDPEFDLVFYIKLSDEVATKRLLGRGRSDDTEELIAKRLRIFSRENSKIIKIFKKRNILHEINGARTIDAISADIIRLTKKWLTREQKKN